MSTEKKTPNPWVTRSRQEEWILPEFVGVGHALEEAKFERKKAFEQYMQVNNRVLYFEKEYERTNKSIDNHQKALEKVVAIRSRRNSDRKQKEEFNEMNREKHEMQKLNASAIRENVKNGLQNSRTYAMDQKRSISNDVKDLLTREFSWRREKDQNQRFWMMENFQNIESDKKRGRKKVNDFMSERNAQALKYYNSQIKKQKEAKEHFEKEISRLSAKQLLIVNHLKQSYAHDDVLRSTLNKASDIEIEELEQKLKRRRPKTLDPTKRFDIANGNLLSSIEIRQQQQEKEADQKLPTETLQEKETINPQRQGIQCCCHKQPVSSFLTTTDFKTIKPKKKKGKRRRKTVIII